MSYARLFTADAVSKSFGGLKKRAQTHQRSLCSSLELAVVANLERQPVECGLRIRRGAKIVGFSLMRSLGGASKAHLCPPNFEFVAIPERARDQTATVDDHCKNGPVSILQVPYIGRSSSIRSGTKCDHYTLSGMEPTTAPTAHDSNPSHSRRP